MMTMKYVCLSQADVGVMFIGPSSDSIKSMGDKIESKRIAAAAKVNLIPGFDGEVENEDDAVKIANQIGNLSIVYCLKDGHVIIINISFLKQFSKSQLVKYENISNKNRVCLTF